MHDLFRETLLKLCSKVTIGFLMVGHTHQILDQVFSHVSRCFLSVAGGVLSFLGLENLLRK